MARGLLLAPRLTGEARELASDVVEGDAFAFETAFPRRGVLPAGLLAIGVLPFSPVAFTFPVDAFLATFPAGDFLAFPADAFADSFAFAGVRAFRAGVTFFSPDFFLNLPAGAFAFALTFDSTEGSMKLSEKPPEKSKSFSSVASFFDPFLFVDLLF